jgi:hypothetical protein
VHLKPLGHLSRRPTTLAFAAAEILVSRVGPGHWVLNLSERRGAGMSERESSEGRPADDLVRQQEDAAAAEAARIGGPAPDYGTDEEDRPLEESGQGVAEGFEDAERELIEHATHAEQGFRPQDNAFTPEVESDRATGEYAEPDEVDPTEVVRDPEARPDDPGEGPGIADER